MQTEFRYIAYCRKSSEDAGRQVLSIESQLRELKEYAEKNHLNLIDYLHEEKSAHKRGRPIFGSMMARIERGEANALLVWIPSRVARNANDGGWVITLMDEGIIKEVRTTSRIYQNNSDDKFFLALEFNIAKKTSDDLKSHVKTGHYTKVLQGWRNGVSPLGYLNNLDRPKGERNIIADPDRFDLVRNMLELFLSGEWSVRKLQKETIRWGLKTRQSKRQGGKYLCIAHVYRILTQPFYAGWFWVTNPTTGEREFRKGEHEPMITLEQFDLIQARLGRKGKPRPRSDRFFPFTGRMECGECSSMITAEEKHQTICTKCKYKFASQSKDACPRCDTKIADMENPTMLHYVYYHCTKRKNPKCSQGVVRVELLEGLLDKALSKFNLSDGFTQWALEELANENEQTIKTQKAVIDTQQQQYKDVVDRLQNLTKLYTSPANAKGDLLSIEEYVPQRQALLVEKKRLTQDQQKTDRKIDEWIDWAENSFDFATAARVWFEDGSPTEKRDIFASLSRSNLVLKDKILTVDLKNPLDLYAAIARKYPSTTIPLEPTKDGAKKGDYLPFAADIPALRMG